MKKLYLASEGNSKLLGVCGGIGETYDIDPTMVRVLIVALGLLTFLVPTVILYLAAWALIPQRPVD
ncbi:MAG: PspC domain-containing protein [Planctomycetes bacterium]|nr:PspC domain-containing protein [Planctomycetota bacterium]